LEGGNYIAIGKNRDCFLYNKRIKATINAGFWNWFQQREPLLGYGVSKDDRAKVEAINEVCKLKSNFFSLPGHSGVIY
jgi:hypothetical protein